MGGQSSLSWGRLGHAQTLTRPARLYRDALRLCAVPVPSVCQTCAEARYAERVPDPFSFSGVASIESGLRALDLIGTVAFAMSGALLGVRKRFDLFGVLVLGCVTAVGGGAIRDTLTGNTPPLFLRDETYLWLAIAGSLTAFAFGTRLARF